MHPIRNYKGKPITVNFEHSQNTKREGKRETKLAVLSARVCRGNGRSGKGMKSFFWHNPWQEKWGQKGMLRGQAKEEKKQVISEFHARVSNR